jgi:hypothetical protein
LRGQRHRADRQEEAESSYPKGPDASGSVSGVERPRAGLWAATGSAKRRLGGLRKARGLAFRGLGLQELTGPGAFYEGLAMPQVASAARVEQISDVSIWQQLPFNAQPDALQRVAMTLLAASNDQHLRRVADEMMRQAGERAAR